MPSRPPGLLGTLALLVPGARRSDWLREWESELAQVRSDGRLGLRRGLDALEDALRLRLRAVTGGASDGTVTAIFEDAGYAVRALVHRPAYVIAAGIPLALGIGANTAIFSVINGVLFHPLPYDDPGRLVVITSDGARRGLVNNAGLTPADFLEWRDTTGSLDGLAALQNSSLGFTELDEPLVPLTHLVTPEFFDLLGVDAALGRTFTVGDIDAAVVILSRSVWQQALGAAPDAIGRTVVLDGAPYVVVGVMAEDLHIAHLLPVQPGLWVPTDFSDRADDRRGRNLTVYGRLAAGASPTDVAEELGALAQRAERLYPDTHTGWGVNVTPVAEFATGAYRQVFGFVILAVALVLLIACANVASLGLSQSIERSREMALRSALGAGTGRLLRQAVLEGSLLAAAAGAAGVVAAFWSLPLLVRLIPGAGGTGSATVGGAAAVPFLDQVGVDGRVLLFSVALILVTGILTGIGPGLRAGRTEIAATLQEAGRGSSAGGSGVRLRDSLVVLETALALVLLVGAGLMYQSFDNLQNVELGYDADRVLSLRNSLRIGIDPRGWVGHFDQARQALEELPGVESASAVSFVPPEFPNANLTFHRPGEASDPASDSRVTVRVVLPGYFETMGIEIVAGRPIDERDTDEAAEVLVVNQEFVRRHYGAAKVVGERLVPDMTGVGGPVRMDSESEWEIVGIAGDIRPAGIDPSPLPMVYVPLAQVPIGIMNLIVRTRDAPELLRRDAERAVWRLGRNMNIYSVESLDRRLGNLLWQPRFASQLLGLFSSLALLLGAAGIYAVLSYSVSRRRQEMGVRLALGANRTRLLRLVIGSGLRLVGLGLVAGTAASYGAARLIAGLLYGVEAADPATHLAVAGLISVVAVLACALPALRAASVDPIEALRAE